MIKKIITFILFIFLLLIGSVLIGNYLAKNQTVPPTQNTQTSKQTVTMAMVAAHNQASDCWQAIDGSVYNLSDFLNSHPAGSEVMIPWCGKDASAAYHTKSKPDPRDHSGKAKAMLAQYFVAKLAAN